MSRYDIEKFDPSPDPDLVCCICQCVLDKAVECPCRHVFCQGCIERWLTNRHTCPTCRKRTMKQDLQPVLPLVQNMLNRLLMICDFRDHGCLEKIMLEHFENHVKDCGYEMKTCRFIKCGKDILKMNLEQHESIDCEHKESLCGGECGLMIALSDRPTHVCMDALKAHIDEKNRMIDTLKSKLLELNNLSQSLNDQLEQLRQQLDENRPRSSLSSFSGSDTDVTEFMSDQESFFDDSNDSFNNQFSANNSDNNIDDIDNLTVVASSDRDTGDNNDNEPVNDVMEQVEVTVVNSLFDLSSRLEQVRDEMRSVLNTGTVADNNNLTENLGMRSARIDDIIDNMSRSINDSSVRSNRNDSQRNTFRDGQNNNNRSVSQVNTTDENRNTHEMSPRRDDLNNSSDRGAYSDHSYSAGSDWRSPGNCSSYSNRSPQPSDRSRSHSYVSTYDQDSLSNRSYISTPDRNSGRSVTPDSYRRFSDRDSRSLSPTSDRYSDRRSNVSHSPSRSSTPRNQSSRYNPELSPSLGEAYYWRSPSINSGRSYRSDNRSWSNNSETPKNSDDQRSNGSCSPRSPASGNWYSDNWNSDNRGSDGSRHSEDNWSYRSRSSVSHTDGVSDDERRNRKDPDRDNSDRESTMSDWCTGRSGSPDTSPRRFDSDDDRASRTPTSAGDNWDQSSDHLTSPSQSETDGNSGTITPPEVTSSEEGSPRKTTPAKSGESSYMSDSSSIHSQSSLNHDRNQSGSDVSSSENNSPLNLRTRSSERRKSVKSKKPCPTSESNKYQSQRANVGRNEQKSDSKTSVDKTDGSGGGRQGAISVGVKSVKIDSKVYQRNISYDKRETKSSTSDSGIFSAAYGSETGPDETLSRNMERKRKANNEKENATNTENLRKSKRNRSATVGLDSLQIIPSSSATIQTSLPQSLTTPSNVNVKIDLSLYNISGQLIPQTKPLPTASSMNNSGSSVIKQTISSHTSASSPVKNVTDNTKAAAQKQKPTRRIHTRSTTPSNVKPDGPGPKTTSQSKDSTEKRGKRQAASARQGANNTSLGNRDFPNSWRDDSDSESDQTWVPGSDKGETDDTLTEEEEILSDSSYEVLIPKTAADLLDEYKSDETDESWSLD